MGSVTGGLGNIGHFPPKLLNGKKPLPALKKKKRNFFFLLYKKILDWGGKKKTPPPVFFPLPRPARGFNPPHKGVTHTPPLFWETPPGGGGPPPPPPVGRGGVIKKKLF